MSEGLENLGLAAQCPDRLGVTAPVSVPDVKRVCERASALISIRVVVRHGCYGCW